MVIPTNDMLQCRHQSCIGVDVMRGILIDLLEFCGSPRKAQLCYGQDTVHHVAFNAIKNCLLRTAVQKFATEVAG